MSRWEPPLWFDRLGGVAWRGIAIVVAGALLVAGIVGLSAVILPIVLGLLFTSVLHPVARWLSGRGVPPVDLPPCLSVLLLTVALVGVVWLTINAVVDQWPAIKLLIDEARDTLSDAAEDNGASDQTATTLEHGASDAVGEVVNLLLHGRSNSRRRSPRLIAAIILSLLVTFFFLKDGPSMWRWIVARFDTRDAVVDRVGQRVWPVVTGYMLGQATIAAIDATMIALGALVLGVPNVGAILVITFFGAFIPYIGALVAGFVAVMLAVADGGIARGVAMLSIVILVQLIEGNVLQPWIQGRAVKLHPLVVALSVAAGGALAGFLGVFLAVPVTAAGFVALSELRAAGVLGPTRPERRCRRDQASSQLIPKATAKPTTVINPTARPACSNASGIIDVASIVSIAPAAKANMNASVSGAAPSRRTKPAAAAACRRQGDHRPEDVHPRQRPPAGAQTDRGGDRLGDVGDEHGNQHRDADVAGLQQRQPEHRALGNSVEQRAEHDGQSTGLRGRAADVLALGVAEPPDRHVPDGEHDGPDEQAEERAPELS